ncbi:MAG: NifB/NifX family molybdenum-iron cluster-binding protein [Desulfamplus sp.]|nr:NifB/NifX family molybdenum-iron cluster-binding protein [Desulfamplus sp.]
MKVAVSSSGESLDSEIDLRFGRASYFLIVETDTLDFEVKPNEQNMDLPQGAGIQAGKTVVNCGVEAIITGNCGPKAYNVLESAGVKVVTGVNGTVREVLEKFKKGELQYSVSANVEGHWV